MLIRFWCASINRSCYSSSFSKFFGIVYFQPLLYWIVQSSTHKILKITKILFMYALLFSVNCHAVFFMIFVIVRSWLLNIIWNHIKINVQHTCYKKRNWFNFCIHWIRGCCYYYFLLPISRESIALGSNFRNGDFDGFTRFEVPWIRKTHF